MDIVIVTLSHIFAVIHDMQNVLPSLDFKTEGSMEFITQSPGAVAPERSEGATKGLHAGYKLHSSPLCFEI